ncbi:ImmA/IrrE family metallo-endopeptidase [Polaromonas sp. P5_D5]
MNSTIFGDTLEEKIHALFLSEIENDRFWVKKECCKLHRKKGYYSKDRGKNIIFDVSIEVFTPGRDAFSMVILIECKNYNHPVPVDDAEEFFAKAQQISGANVKCVVASTNSFQAGTRAFSKSKGIGLLRYFDKQPFKWELDRSASGTARTTNAEASVAAEYGLAREDFTSNFFDLYCQSTARTTNSLWDFVEDFVLETSLSKTQIREVGNGRDRLISQVKYLEKDELENRASSILFDVGYSTGQVSLNALCELEETKYGLKVLKNVVPPDSFISSPPLGRITFDPLEIHIFRQPEDAPYGRERFTLAHELAHHLLGHSKYMSREYCDEGDFSPSGSFIAAGTHIGRMEFQANFLASCILIPRTNVIADFRGLIKELNIPNKGYGTLFVDTQPCNLESYEKITTHLMQRYGVSRKAITIRLEDLGLLVDARLRSFQTVQRAYESWSEAVR